MVYEKLVEWIKSEEAKGFSEEQLKQSLLKSGYKPENVNEAILLSHDNLNLSFNQLLLQKGKLFTALFYALLIIFSLELIAGIILPIFFISNSTLQSRYPQLNFLIVTFSLLIAGLTLNYVIKRNLYAILVIIFLLSPIGVGAGMLLFSASAVLSFVSIYVSLIYALLVGMIVAYSFSKVLSDSKKYLIAGIVFSSVLGLVFAIDNGIAFVISRIARQVEETNPPGGIGGMMGVANFSIMKVNIFLILMLIFFNIPYLISYFKRKDKNPALFRLYLIIPILFAALFFISRYLAKIIIQTFLTQTFVPF